MTGNHGLDRGDEPDLLRDAVQTLTAAARRHSKNGDPADFADFIASALAATAANVGGPDELLAGRPESWEASLVHELVQATISDDPTIWVRYRTEPLVVPLNVAELIETHLDHDDLLGLEDAIDSLNRRHRVNNRVMSERTIDKLAETIEEIELRYRVEYRHYADDFAAAVHREADALGLPGAITIDAGTDPASRWWETPGIHNPHSPYGDDIDPIAAELWETAHTATPLPNVDIRIGGPQP